LLCEKKIENNKIAVKRMGQGANMELREGQIV
jgi:hypothetical protein